MTYGDELTQTDKRQSFAEVLQLLLERTSFELDELIFDFLCEPAPEFEDEDDFRTFLDQAGPSLALRVHLPEDEDGLTLTIGFLTTAIAELTTEDIYRDNRLLLTPARYLERVQPIDDAQTYTLLQHPTEPREPEQLEPYTRYRAALHEYEALGNGSGEGTTVSNRIRAWRELSNVRMELVAPDRHFQLVERWNGTTLRFALIVGFSHLGLDAVLQREWTRDYPPYSPDDLAVEIEWTDRPLSLEEAQAASRAYQYSLEASVGIRLTGTERASVEELRVLEEAEFENPPIGRLRPLRDGPGLDELHSLYLRATATTDLEVQHLFFTKVIEYVSQTVVRQERNEAVRRWLTAENALRPDAEYIEDLARLIGTHDRRAREDLGALKLTVITCCDALLLAPLAPQFLDLASITTDSSPQERKQAMERLAEAIHSTRNEIAHAKANYEPTGIECPPEELGTLVGCMRQIAQTAIAWYSDQPATLRVHR